jgi:hypothetical protein
VGVGHPRKPAASKIVPGDGLGPVGGFALLSPLVSREGVGVRAGDTRMSEGVYGEYDAK